MGFRLVRVYKGVDSKHDAWRDVGWWELALREGAAMSEARPSPPVVLPSATEVDGWNAALERGLRLPRSGT